VCIFSVGMLVQVCKGCLISISVVIFNDVYLLDCKA